MKRRWCDKIRRAGIRMVGPNCMGLLNTDPRVRAERHVLARRIRRPGRVAMSTQSGALGPGDSRLRPAAEHRDLDVRLGRQQGRRVGQRPDPVLGRRIRTRTSSCSTSRASAIRASSARSPARVARTKPIVAVKSGRSAAGARAASSHTGALASSDAIVEALFRRAGVIRTRHASRSSSTSRRCSPTSRCRGAAGSRS